MVDALLPEPLRFPRGVRFPRRHEVPEDQRHAFSRIETANITTGYVINHVADQPYNAYIEANVHAERIFDVFRQLAGALMPEIASPIIGFKDDEPVFGPYTDLDLAIAVFEPHIDLLQNDGFLEFGIIHQSDAAFEEVFVASPKYFKIWTKDARTVEELLQRSGIPHCERLQFIDEYPMVSLSEGSDGNAQWPAPFWEIRNEFDRLPVR